MKKIFVTAILIALVLTVSACSKDEPAAPAVPTPVPPAPAPPPTPVAEPEPVDSEAAPVEGEANVLDDTNNIFSGDTTVDLGSEVDGVACDSTARKITFTLTNSGDYVWNIDQDVSFTDVGDRKNVKVFINGFEANRGSPQYHPQTNEVMFGPSTTFSENCGGVSDVAPGESITCTLIPVKLNAGTGSTEFREVNEIWTDSPSVDEYIEFTC